MGVFHKAVKMQSMHNTATALADLLTSLLPYERKRKPRFNVAIRGEKDPRKSDAQSGTRAIRNLLYMIYSDQELKKWLIIYTVLCLVFDLVELAVFLSNLTITTKIEEALQERDPTMFLEWKHYLWFSVLGAVLKLLRGLCTWRMRRFMQQVLFFQTSRAFYSIEEPDAQMFYRINFMETPFKVPEQQICEDTVVLLETLEVYFTLPSDILRLLGAVYRLLFTAPVFFMTGVMCGMIPSMLMPRVQKLYMDIVTKDYQIGGAAYAMLNRACNNAESIALASGGRSELARLQSLATTSWRIKLKVFVADMIVTSVSFLARKLTTLAPGALLVHAIAAGRISLPEAMMLFNLQHTFSEMWQSLTNDRIRQFLNVAGPAIRIQRMLTDAKTLEKVAARRRHAQKKACAMGLASVDGVIAMQDRIFNCPDTVLELCDVTLMLPAGNGRPELPLIDNLSFRIDTGDSLVITGPSGIGKTVLCCAIHGMWGTGRGCIKRNCQNSVFIVPQRPFVFHGSLEENLLYPHSGRSDVTDADIRQALKEVNLGSELESCKSDDVRRWSETLSLGQQQRVSVARGLLQRGVKLMVLDEGTSAMDLTSERIVYTAVARRMPSYVSVAHRPSVRQYHKRILHLRPNDDLHGALAKADSPQPCQQHSMEFRHEAFKDKENVTPLLSSQSCQEEAQMHKSSFPDETAREAWNFRVAVEFVFRVMWPTFSQHKLNATLALVGMFGSIMVHDSLQMRMVGSTWNIGMRMLRKEKVVVEDFWIFAAGSSWKLPIIMVAAQLEALFSTYWTMWSQETLRLYLLERYLASRKRAYYMMLMGPQAVSNPADRISQTSCDLAMSGTVGTLVTFFRSGFNTFLMMSTMFGMAPTTAKVICLCSLISALATLWVTRVFTATYSKFLFRIATVRSHLEWVRHHAEAVAILNGSNWEYRWCQDKFRWTMQAGYLIVLIRKLIGDVVLVFTEIVGVIGYFIWGDDIISGSMDYYGAQGFMSQMVMSFGRVNMMFGTVIHMGGPLVNMRNMIEIIEKIKIIESGNFCAQGNLQISETEFCDDGHAAFELDNVTLRAPARGLNEIPAVLFDKVSLRLPARASLLIMGPSGIGKSSLVRAAAGLWTDGEGSIRCASPETIMCVPQRPYLCWGTLREQLLYPKDDFRSSDDQAIRDQELIRVLKLLQLERLLRNPGLDGLIPIRRDHPDKAWLNFGDAVRYTSSIALGEIQRISIARILLRRNVQLVLLDECTSALSEEQERNVYELLKDHVEAYVSVGHRPQLRAYHSHILCMEKPVTTGEASSPVTSARFLTMDEHRTELGEHAVPKEP